MLVPPGWEEQAANLIRALEHEASTGGLAGAYATGTVAACWVDLAPFHSPDPTSQRERYIMQIGLLTQGIA